MRNILAALLLAAALFTCLPGIQPVSAGVNDLTVYSLPLKIGTTIAASATNTGVYRLPREGTIESLYVTNDAAVASDASHYMTVTLYKNGAANGSFTTLLTGLASGTPRKLTPTTLTFSAGDVFQAKVTKTGNGAATTDMGIVLSYTVGNWSN